MQSYNLKNLILNVNLLLLDAANFNLSLRITYFWTHSHIMELAIKLHKYLTNGSNSHEILNFYNEIEDKDTLAMISEYFMEQYNKTPQEFITDKFQVDEVYAISSTLKYIREPIAKNIKSRDAFYQKIGYSIPQEQR